MKLFRPKSSVKGLLFDIDSTLYRNEEFVSHQYRVLIGAYAEAEELEFEAAKDRLEGFRSREASENGGRRPSLANASKALGYPIERSVTWRRSLIEPERFLVNDSRLREVLSELAGSFRLAALTNNPREIGTRTLAALGIEDLFPIVLGLDSTMHSKPDPEPFDAALKAMDCAYEEILMIGDRYEVDLEYPLSRGAGGLLAESMEDLYRLPRLLEEIP